MADVYLAFDKTDQGVADDIAAALKARGHSPLMPDTIDAADAYRNKADIMIIIASPQGLASPFVQEDVRVSRQFVIPRLIFKHLEPSAELLRPFVFDRQSTDIDGLIGDLEKRLAERAKQASRNSTPAAEPETGAPPSPAPGSKITARKKNKPQTKSPPPAPLEESRFHSSSSIHEGAAVMDWMEMEQTPPQGPDGKALKLEEGKLVHKVGEQMRKGQRETVEARLGRVGAPNLALNLAGGGKLVEENLAIVETMTVELISPDGAFAITPQTRKTQLVAGEVLQNAGLDAAQFGRWLWTVEPMEAGNHELIFKVSADVHDGRGLPSSTALPDRFFKIDVSIDYARVALSTAKWVITGLAGMVLAGFIGALTQDVWWPGLKLWLGL